MKIKIVFYLAFVSMAFVVYRIAVFDGYINVSDKPRFKPESWQTFTRNQDQIKTRLTLDKDRKTHRLLGPSRSPSGLSHHHEKVGDRYLSGVYVKSFKQSPSDFKFVNYINKDWKNLLGKRVLKHLPNDSQVHIKKIASFIHIFDDRAKYLEQVLVTTVYPDGRVSNYRAAVNSENGALEQTWDRQVEENVTRKPVSFSPSGSL